MHNQRQAGATTTDERSDPSQGQERPYGPSSLHAIHPTLAALEKADTSTVVIDGFPGSSKAGVLRLYEALDTQAYVEVSTDAIVHLEPVKDGQPGMLRAFVRTASEVRSVRQWRVPAGDYKPMPPGPDFPTPRTCESYCEDSFKSRLTAYAIKVTGCLRSPRPSAECLAEAGTDLHRAKDALYNCLVTCAQRGQGRYFFGIDAVYTDILRRNGVVDGN